jgi:hypothetical protein
LGFGSHVIALRNYITVSSGTTTIDTAQVKPHNSIQHTVIENPLLTIAASRAGPATSEALEILHTTRSFSIPIPTTITLKAKVGGGMIYAKGGLTMISQARA